MLLPSTEAVNAQTLPATSTSSVLSAHRVAVVGVGVVGQLLIRLLRDRGLARESLRVLARQARGLSVDGEYIEVEEVSPEGFEGCTLVFFAGGEAKEGHLGPAAVERGAVVIDNGDAFRLDPSVPLVVPEINADSLAEHRGLIASPNCSAIQLAMVLAPLARCAPLRRVVVCTYQAVSGKGRAALERLDAETRAVTTGAPLPSDSPFAEPILGNLACDWPYDDGGHTREEVKVIAETRRILGQPTLRITATTVRVPVVNAHSQAVNVEFERSVSLAEAREALRVSPSVVVTDDFPTPQRASGTDTVSVGRVRPDKSVPDGLWLWSVCDNLRKGAALNAVQIAEELVARGLLAVPR